MLKEQVDVASREVATLEEKVLSLGRERNATVDGLTHKVRAYETLELELDSAVLRCADNNGAASLVSVPGAPPAPGGDGGGIPGLRDAALAAGLSRPERRVRHAVLLAQKLLRTEAALDQERRASDAFHAAAAAADARAAQAKAKLDDAAKPTQFLLAALNDRDASLATLRQKLHRADRAATDAANAAEATACHNATLEREILRLVKHRDELAALRSALQQLRHAGPQQGPPPTMNMPPHQMMGMMPPGPPPMGMGAPPQMMGGLPPAMAPPPPPQPVVLAPSAQPTPTPASSRASPGPGGGGGGISPHPLHPHTTPRGPNPPTAQTPSFHSRQPPIISEVA